IRPADLRWLARRRPPASRRHAHRLAWRSLSWPVRGHRRRPGSPDRRTRTLGTLPTGWGEPPAASRAAVDPAKLIAPSSQYSSPGEARRIGADRLLVKTQRTDHLSTTGRHDPSRRVFRILPVGLFGSASSTVSRRGYLNAARRPRQ